MNDEFPIVHFEYSKNAPRHHAFIGFVLLNLLYLSALGALTARLVLAAG